MTDDEMINCRDDARQLERAVAVVHRLRMPGGCPWDAEQTHESIVPNLIEECYECIDAIRANDREHLREELGDVLLQVLLHAEIARGNPDEGFSVNDVARELSDKLVRRHPHVFAEENITNARGVLTRWESIKRSERNTQDKPPLYDTGKGLPELLRAVKLSAKAAGMGLGGENVDSVIERLHEETAEAEATRNLPNTDARVEEELGDLLFTVVDLCRHRGVNPELALHKANEKFIRRFHAMSDLPRRQSIPCPEQATSADTEKARQAIKAPEK